jgi:DNA-binding NtrC family response regulator
VVEGEGQRILYVDDDETLIFVMTRILRRLRYEPRGYGDPHAALQAFRTNPHDFDGAIVDFRMPGMQGSLLIEELRRIRPDLPVAITSGYRGDEGLVDSEWEFIAKPSTLEELSGSLRTMFAKR